MTTSDPSYRKARARLDNRDLALRVPDIAILFGVVEKTVRNWALLGRYGAKRIRPGSSYHFDHNRVREGIGLPLLPEPESRPLGIEEIP
jgi:hypothetical protein